MADTSKWYQLPPDPAQWQPMIISNLARKLPEIPSYISGIDIPQMDPVMGSADGLVYLTNGMGAIPITVRQNRLAPMDILVTKNDEFYPLSENFIQQMYSDNVIGTPQNPPSAVDDDVEEGPAYRVKRLNTIDQVKQASQEVKNQLKEKIASSAQLLDFFGTHRPGIISALLEPAPVTKEASVKQELETPEIWYLAKNDSGYTFNGDPVTIKQASELMNVMRLGTEDRAELLRGGYACLDGRTKHAFIVDTSDYEVIKTAASSGEGYYVATALDLDSTPYKGFLIQCARSVADLNGSESPIRYNLFIGPNFHSVQSDIVVVDKTEIKLHELMEACTPDKPHAGAYGIAISGSKLLGPFRITGYIQHGVIGEATVMYPGGFDSETIPLGGEFQFYSIPEADKALQKHPDDVFLTSSGTNCILKKVDGGLLYKGQVQSYANVPMTLMKDLGIDIQDALHAVKTASDFGSYQFKVAGSDKENKETKEKKESNPEAQEQQAQQAQQDPQAQQGQQGQAQPMAPQMPPNPGVMQNQINPINTEDLQDIAKMNDPAMMDSYLSGTLADANVAGQEELMMVSDDLNESMKSLSKLLFKVRLGQIDYVNENDVRIALNKMGDVAKTIGFSASQMIGPEMSGSASQLPGQPTTALYQQEPYNY